MMTLTVNIMYKSNWQQDSLRDAPRFFAPPKSSHCYTVRRRNKWICALKKALADVKIYGSTGNPDAIPAPTRYTQVPWELVKEEDDNAAESKKPSEPSTPEAGWQLSDKNAAMCKFKWDELARSN